MKFSVRHDCVGSSVVKYDLDFELAEKPDVTVTVANTVPPDASSNRVGRVPLSIRDGFIRVLKPLWLGAAV